MPITKLAQPANERSLQVAFKCFTNGICDFFGYAEFPTAAVGRICRLGFVDSTDAEGCALPQYLQKALLSSSSFPQYLQNIFSSSLSFQNFLIYFTSRKNTNYIYNIFFLHQISRYNSFVE